MGAEKQDSEWGELDQGLESQSFTPSSEAEILESLTEDAGATDSLRNTILTYVSLRKYKSAIREMREYQKYKENFPKFTERTNRYFDMVVEVLEYFDSKPAPPNFRSLPAAKQQEYLEHFQSQLQTINALLKRIEQIDNDLKVADVRSTVWVMKTLMFCISAICFVAFVREGTGSMAKPADVILDDLVKLVLSFIY